MAASVYYHYKALVLISKIAIDLRGGHLPLTHQEGGCDLAFFNPEVQGSEMALRQSVWQTAEIATSRGEHMHSALFTAMQLAEQQETLCSFASDKVTSAKYI